MRRRLMTGGGVALLVFAAGCRDLERGCTPENCRRMLRCRVELNGGPAAACWLAAEQPAGFDSTPYCVETCRRQGAGGTVACLAERAERCEAAGDHSARDAVVAECAGTGSGQGDFDFEGECASRCDAAREECDLACVGGPRCADCRRLGASCEGCLDAGFSGCADCSTACGHDYFECTRRC